MPNRFQGLHLLINCSIVNMLASIPFTPAPTISRVHVGNFPYTTAVPTLTNERWILLELFSTRSHLHHRKNSMERLLYAVPVGDKTFPSETEHTCLPTPGREPMTDQSIRVTYRSMCEDLHEQKWLRDTSMGDSWSTLQHSIKAAQQVGESSSQVTLLF